MLCGGVFQTQACFFHGECSESSPDPNLRLFELLNWLADFVLIILLSPSSNICPEPLATFLCAVATFSACLNWALFLINLSYYRCYAQHPEREESKQEL